MKLIHGRTLADELECASRADLPRLLGIFEHICQTVGFAHARGIVHRDLKPANIMVGAFGEVLVMDWGLAKEIGSGNPADPHRPAEGVRGNDQAGQACETPAFMAPEQARGESVDARADVFALGGILAVMLTGKPPFVVVTTIHRPIPVLRAAQAELTECFALLDRSGADPELVALAVWCLGAGAAAEPPGERVRRWRRRWPRNTGRAWEQKVRATPSASGRRPRPRPRKN